MLLPPVVVRTGIEAAVYAIALAEVIPRYVKISNQPVSVILSKA
jgi:hypothetical protein